MNPSKEAERRVLRDYLVKTLNELLDNRPFSKKPFAFIAEKSGLPKNTPGLKKTILEVSKIFADAKWLTRCYNHPELGLMIMFTYPLPGCSLDES